MGNHRFYRIINIIILPVSAFIALQVLMSIFVALANPAMLLGIFVLACVPLYAFTANYFYNKSIKKGEYCKPSLKDWIKVNAIVSLIFCALAIFGCLGLLMLLDNEKRLNELLQQMPSSPTGPLSMEEFKKLLKFYVYFFLPFTILLVIHIIITFRLLRKYKHMFGYSTNDPQ